MEIKICGPGCSKCEEAYAMAQKAIHECGQDIKLVKVTDFQEIAMLGIFSTPAVVVNNEIKCVGRVPGAQELRDWLGTGS